MRLRASVRSGGRVGGGGAQAGQSESTGKTGAGETGPAQVRTVLAVRKLDLQRASGRRRQRRRVVVFFNSSQSGGAGFEGQKRTATVCRAAERHSNHNSNTRTT